MSVIEHWFCPGCGEIDGPRAGMRCHGPGNTGGCASVRNEVVEISHDAAERLRGAVEILRRLAQMPLTASGKNFDPLVKAARDLLPEYTTSRGR